GHLRALGMFGYWAAYTHYWVPQLSSTVVYSQVEADSFPSPAFDVAKGQAPYRHGRYAAVNLIYETVTPVVVKKAGTLFTGIEYLYGEKELLNGAAGVDHRLQATLGVKF